MFFSLTDDPQKEDYPAIMVRFSWLQDVLIKVLMPFYLIYITFVLVVLRKREQNGFKTPAITAKLTALKNVQFVPDISADLVRKRAKELSTPQMKVTFNDILMTSISKSMSDYLREKTGDRTT